jgi:phage tail-like protein
MAVYYPPVSFYFEVKIAGASDANDSSFAEASGLDAERNIVEIVEGGENRFTHRLPDRGKYANLVLKRGMMVASSTVFDWCSETLESDLGKSVKPRDIDVSLLDPKGSPLVTWNFKSAWPVKWNLGPFNAKESEIAVETLEFSYSYMTRKRLKTSAATGMFEG